MSKTHHRWLVGAKRLGLVTITLALMLPLLGQEAPPAEPSSGEGDTPAAPARPQVYLLPIEGPINQLTQQSLARMMREATEAGAAAIVFDLDTPGGQVGAALEICDMIKAETAQTTAWVNPAAYSAGSMISVACNQIVIAGNARIGDSAPILVGPQGLQNIGETERAKIESPILAEFRESAKRNGYPIALSEAMVTLGPPIYRIVNDQSGEKAYVWADQLYNYGLEAPGPQEWRRDRQDAQSGPESSDESQDQPAPQQPSPLPGLSLPGGVAAGLTDAVPVPGNEDEPTDEPGQAPGDAADAAEAPDRAEGDAVADGQGDDAGASGNGSVAGSGDGDAAAEGESDGGAADGAEGAWRIDKQVLEAETLLTMLTDEAIEYGFAKAEINSERELLEHLGLPDAEIVRLAPNWSENLVAWLTSPFIRGILTIVLLMGLYSEMQAPGLGFAGVVALVAAAILLGAPYLSGLAQTWEILVIVAGMVLLAVEIFVIPGFGVAGIAGLVLMFAGLVLTFVPEDPGPGVLPSLPGTWDALAEGLVTVLIAGVISMIGMGVMARYSGSIPIFGRLVLQTDQARQSQGGQTVTSAGVGGVSMGAGEESGVAVGDEGRAMGSLRPIGRAEIGSSVVEVTTTGAWVEDGQPVRVTNVRGSRVEVEPV